MSQHKTFETTQFVPIISTEAGSALTAESWANSGIQLLSCSLETLLMKPGYDALLTLPSLKNYLGAPTQIVLNASLPQGKRNVCYTVRSTYDGKITRLSLEQLITLACSLEPDILILPTLSRSQFESIQSLLPNHKPIFLSLSDSKLPPQFGYYQQVDENESADNFQLQHFTKPSYLSGEFSLDELKKLDEKGVSYLESDKPAFDALHGRLYTEVGMLDITEKANEFDFEPIDEHCTCTSCYEGLTRAYFHHLFAQTPLLCQRLLIEHNIHYTNATLAAIFRG
ncbi:tRNA-guanine transglycosylase [Legionella yabuuchiae]|uniref:tRNA-guanine transglycosylase n=1 Tax=Legionella yabuuchiae TaxID=376727 RepID=UPI0010559924|nr:tRNA-guanine transglycosylase [Legionella yabuuchiae]